MLAEIIFGAVLLILIFFCFLQAMELTFTLGNGIIASGYFPSILTIFLMILIIFNLVSLMMKRKQNQAPEPVSKTVKRKQIFLLAAMIISILLGKYLGIIIAIGVFLMGTLVLVQNMKWTRSAIFSLATMAVIDLIFEYLLGLNLPGGIF